MAAAEMVAVRDLGLTPWDFRRFTVREFRWRVKGHKRREQQTWIQLATVAAWVMAPHLKESTTATRLLGWPENWMVDGDRDG